MKLGTSVRFLFPTSPATHERFRSILASMPKGAFIERPMGAYSPDEQARNLMEVAAEDSFRIRSYRRAAEALEALPQQVSEIYEDEKALLAIPGIGKGMAGNIRELMTGGKLAVHEEMLKKFHPSMLQLLKISGLGPKTIALIWDAFKVCDVDGVAKLASEGKLRHLGLPDAPRRSTLAYANQHRPWQLCRSVFCQLLGRCRDVAGGHGFRFKNKRLSLDATLIELCATVFDWAQ